MHHRANSTDDIPHVICFLIGFAIFLIGLAAAVWHATEWARTGRWQSTSNGEMMLRFGWGDDRLGWGALQPLVNRWWIAPFWAVMLAVGVIIIYLPNLLRLIIGRR